MPSAFGPPTITLRPPLDALDQLVEPLDPGELQVLRSLATLGPGWTVYTKPRVGLDRLDFLVFHDVHGVCAIEVVGWTPDRARPGEHGDVELLGSDGLWAPTAADPRLVASRTRASLFDQFYALPEHGGTPTSAIRAVLVLPALTTAQAHALLPVRPPDEPESLVGVFGGDTIAEAARDVVVGLGCAVPPAPSLSKLRRHINASERIRSTRAPAWSSDGVRDLALNPGGELTRMVRGAAGSGKSFGLTGRAAHLAADGKRVLILSLNVTLANRLRSMANERCHEIGANPTLIACSNFHSFCTRVVQDAELAGYQLSAPRGAPWTVGIVAKATQAFEEGFRAPYDAVLVDEGQDFTIEWWNLLRRHVLAPGGEMLAVGDPTQDIYDRDELSAATIGDAARAWAQLDESHRLPADLLDLTNEFAAEHLDGEQVSGRTPAGPDQAARTVRRWIDVDRVPLLGRAVGREVVRLLRDDPQLRPGDVAFVCDYHHDGVAAVRVIEEAGIPVHHIFSRDPDAPRRVRKHRFWPDADAVKGCTAHSLKGWEVPAVVTGIGVDDRAARLAYIAMTRVSIRPDGTPSYISIVNADRRLDAFGRRFDARPATPPRPGPSGPPPLTTPPGPDAAGLAVEPGALPPPPPPVPVTSGAPCASSAPSQQVPSVH
ncbi:AAA family ATPase [Ilumatobacter sp.]|uniref:AAA family ATPase n=1 Tax=Ilumatobacter sp. TaxID=1967498 RepID=UPI003B51927D